MQFMLLIYAQESVERNLPVQDLEAIMASHFALKDEASKRGILLGSNPLGPTASAKTVRRGTDGRVLVTDGPFAETKEQLGGYYLLECRDIEEAVEYAKRLPTSCAANTEVVEVRPLLPIEELIKHLRIGEVEKCRPRGA